MNGLSLARRDAIIGSSARSQADPRARTRFSMNRPLDINKFLAPARETPASSGAFMKLVPPAACISAGCTYSLYNWVSESRGGVLCILRSEINRLVLCIFRVRSNVHLAVIIVADAQRFAFLVMPALFWDRQLLRRARLALFCYCFKILSRRLAELADVEVALESRADATGALCNFELFARCVLNGRRCVMLLMAGFVYVNEIRFLVNCIHLSQVHRLWNADVNASNIQCNLKQ